MLTFSIHVGLQFCRIRTYEGQFLCRERFADKSSDYGDGKGIRCKRLLHRVIENICGEVDVLSHCIVPLPDVPETDAMATDTTACGKVEFESAERLPVRGDKIRFFQHMISFHRTHGGKGRKPVFCIGVSPIVTILFMEIMIGGQDF